jgi:Mn-dependent DtxR family transcriptional regulator
MDNQQLILETMKKQGKPMRPGDIAKAAGLEKDIVAKALKELRKKGLVDSPKACFYASVEK